VSGREDRGEEERPVIHPAVIGWLFPRAVAMAAEIAAKRELAERLGIHEEAMRLAQTTVYSYTYWVDRLALAIAIGESLGTQEPA